MAETSSLLNKLIDHSQEIKTQFHMPSHCSGNSVFSELIDFTGKNVFTIDQTELDKFDNLSNPAGIIMEAQNKIADIYNCKQSYMLVNGSTSGIISVLTSILKDNSKVIVARNCHKSVISSLILTGAEPVWVLPEWNNKYDIFESIDPLMIEKEIKLHSKIDAVVITSPTYEGVCSDIQEISRICKKNKIPLIVDEAHGGHFMFSDHLPRSAVTLGADAVIQSTHKTCTSLTQSALLHIPENSLINTNLLSECLNIYNTSSPSYILMSSIESAVLYMNSFEGRQKLKSIIDLTTELRAQLNQTEHLSIFDFKIDNFQDKTKLLFTIKGFNGYELADILEIEHKIYVESCNDKSVLVQINIGNDTDDITKLYNTISGIKSKQDITLQQSSTKITSPIQVLKPRKAFFSESESIPSKNAIGRISRYCYTKCPPGYPFLVPGEQITDKHVKYFMPNEFIEVVI